MGRASSHHDHKGLYNNNAENEESPVRPVGSTRPLVNHSGSYTPGGIKTSRLETREVVIVALLTVVSILLSLLEISLFPGVTWLKYDASIVPAAVCGLLFGPFAGIVCGVVAAVVHGVLFANYLGAFVNILVMLAFVVPTSVVFRRYYTRKSAIIGVVFGMALATIVAILLNIFVTPSYLGVPVDAVAEMIIPVLLPFNIVKGVFNGVLTLVVFRAIMPFFNSLKIAA